MKKLAVLSGKGGTGKTTIAVSIALGLNEKGYRVGLLDVDLSGRNVLDALGNHPIDVVGDHFIPAEVEGLKYISLGHIASTDEPILWGSRIHESSDEKGVKVIKLIDDYRSAVRQLLEKTDWKNIDYLICDFPPGTGGEVQEMLPLMDYVVLVTVPSHLSESNVRRQIEMCRETQVPILGLIKNMTLFQCPNCGVKTRIFPEDHSFEEYGIKVLCEVPLDLTVAKEKRIRDLPVEEIINSKPILLKKREHTKTIKFKLLFLRLLGKTFSNVFGD